MERRKYPRLKKQVPFIFQAEEFEIAAESMNLSCNGVCCQVNKAISPLTNLKVVLELPCGDKKEHIACNGIVVRAEKETADMANENVYNIAIFFHEINDTERTRIIHFLKN